MIETFLFDMGNVLVFFSHQRMCDQIAKVTRLPSETIRRTLFDEGWEGRLERGEITESDLLHHLRSIGGSPCELADLITAAADIFWLNEPMVPILASLKQQGKRLVLLSNTSHAHIASVVKQFPVLSFFDHLVLSCEVGHMKPDAEIYQAAINNLQCAPENCFYTDDIELYVDRGRAHGLQAEVFTTTDELQRQLRARGLDLKQ